MISTGECGRSDTMTQIRKRTIEMLERLPEEKMIYVFNILQNIEALSLNGDALSGDTSDDAFATLMKYSRTLPEDFDYKAELESARMEKYGSIN